MNGTSVCGEGSPPAVDSRITIAEKPLEAGGVRPDTTPVLPLLTDAGGVAGPSVLGGTAGAFEQAETPMAPARRNATLNLWAICQCRRRAKPGPCCFR
jgi:hypothetical protein